MIIKQNTSNNRARMERIIVAFLILIFVFALILAGSKKKVGKVRAAAVSNKILPKLSVQRPISQKSETLINLKPSSTPTPTIAPTPVGYCLRVPVIFYHHIQPQAQAAAKGQTSLSVDSGIFDGQMAYLARKGYHSITVEQLVLSLRNHASLPGKTVAITFDDGYRDNADFAAPVLQKYGLTGNLMLATGLVGGGDYLSWDQVQQLKNQGWYITDHTWSHYAMNHGSADKMQYEITTAKDQIQEHTGQSADVFTYPYGNFNSTAIGLLQQDGFLGAFTTNPGQLQCDSQLYTLPRTRIGNAPLSSYGL